MIFFAFIIVIVVAYGIAVHHYSYTIAKNKTLHERKWDLNICCGKTDGGGINADILKHAEVNNYVHIQNIYKLPFADKQFQHTLCSHTIEHVDNPEKFFTELSRVSQSVTLVLPPLYDIGAVCNLLEHKWIFLTFKKNHSTLPRYIKLPFARQLQKIVGQINHA